MTGNRNRLATLPAVLLAGALAGCGGGFDHPLPWEASPRTDELIGHWQGVEGKDSGVVALVSRQEAKQEDGALHIELTFPEGSQGTIETRKTKHRATVLADLLAADSVHILQIRLDSYEEFDENGKALSDSAKGYGFRRAALSPETGLSLQRLGGVLGRVAEEEFAGAEIEMDIGLAANCVSDKLEQGLMLEFFQDYLPELKSKLSESAMAELVAALTDDETTIADFERQLAKFVDEADERVDPYKELARMRSCIATKLPGDLVGQVFLKHSDLVFSGDVDRYVRVDAADAGNPVTSP